MVFRNSFNALSVTLEDIEDNVEALMTFSSPTTAALLHMSTVPQHSKSKHQMHKKVHSKPKSYTTLTKKPSPSVGMRSGHSSVKKLPPPMVNANGMVFNSYLKNNYGRNCQSLTVSCNLTISCSPGKSPGSTTQCPTHFSHTPMCHSPCCGPNPCNTTPPMLPHGKCVKLLSNLVIFQLPLKIYAPHHLEACHTWPPKLFLPIPLLTVLALAFLNLLLLCNLTFMSSTLLSWVSFGYQTGMQVFYFTPALLFFYIVVSSVFQLLSSLDRFSPLPPMPTNFHQQLQAWIHSTPVTPGSRPLSPYFRGAMHHGFHPKYPLKFHVDDCWMTCCPSWLPQPPPSFFTLLLMTWTCWTNALHFWFTWLLF